MDGTALPRERGMMPAPSGTRASRPLRAGGPRSAERPAGTAAEVFWTFLRLGLTSFGGPVAHLGYFRAECVERRKWLDEHSFADIVALCQFLPGPASSQIGMGIGILRAGLPGALAAWLGFTMPSALAMILFGYGVSRLGDLSGAAWLHGLKIVAVAVVAQAVGAWRAASPRTASAPRSRSAPRSSRWRFRPHRAGRRDCRRRGDRPRLAGRPRSAAAADAARGARAARAGRSPRWSCFSLCWSDCRCWPWRFRRIALAAVRLRSTARARWCSAAGMSCCRCCRPKSCRRAGCRTTRFSPAMARRRRCRVRCSRSRPISAR